MALLDHLLYFDFQVTFSPNNLDKSWSLVNNFILYTCTLFIPPLKPKSPIVLSGMLLELSTSSINQISTKSSFFQAFFVSFLSDKLKAIKLNLLDEMAKTKEAYQLHLVFSFCNTPGALFRCFSPNNYGLCQYYPLYHSLKWNL